MERISIKWQLLLFSVLMGTVVTAQAQRVDDVLRYSLEYPSYDATSIVMPGIGSHTGFGAYQDNPASMALAKNGYFTFDLSTRYVDESADYLGNSTSFSDSQTDVGDLGFVYKFPTTRGSLVMGAGYSQSNDFNQNFSINGRNERSTITDMYSSRSTEYQAELNTAAFNAFAIEDVSNDSSASIFRFGLPYSDYPGIHQNAEVTERGRMGEYSAFVSAEVLKDLFLGASIGFTHGTYSYRRDFLESDRQDDYDGSIIDSNDDGTYDTDIDNILSVYTIDTELQAFSARLGAIYQPTQQFNVGASFQFPSRVVVDEEFNTNINTTFDNGIEYGDNAAGNFSYDVVRPARLKGGITYQAPQGLTISAMAEGVFYSQAEYDESGINDAEIAINEQIKNTFTDVVNFRGGLEYRVNRFLAPRIGYGFYPDPVEGYGSDRQFFSGGFSAMVSRNVEFDLGVQYSIWDDQSSLYEYKGPGGEILEEQVQEEVSKLKVMAGIKLFL